MRPDSSDAVAVESTGRPDEYLRGALLGNGHRDRIVSLLDEVRAALADITLPPAAQVLDVFTARAALDHSWQRVFTAATSAVGHGGSAANSAGLLALLGEIKQTDEMLTAENLRSRDAAFGRVREALSTLCGCSSTANLVEQAAAAACIVGFDRAIVSRIENSAWITEDVCVVRDEKWGEEILEIGRANPQTLDATLVETEMVRRKVGILVHDVQARPAVNRPIADASLSRSYTAVPLMTEGSVVGFVHADRYYHRRDVDGFDRQLLGLFADGLGQALGRTAMLDRLSAIQTGLDHVAGALASAKNDRVRLAGSTPRTGGSLAVSMRGGAAQSLHDERFAAGGEGTNLTRREVEVLRLMASGDTNGRIARRLVISEGTVKSHVKHILRKLGAANRAEAVSRWLGMEHDRDGSRKLRGAGSNQRDD